MEVVDLAEINGRPLRRLIKRIAEWLERSDLIVTSNKKISVAEFVGILLARGASQLLPNRC